MASLIEDYALLSDCQSAALVAKDGNDLKTAIEDTLDPNKRVDTDLKELWSNP